MKKVYIVTGASSGIGYETAMRLLENKENKVYCLARRVEKMKPLEELGAVTKKLDITKKQDVIDVVSSIHIEEGRIDVLFANAGYGGYGNIESVSEKEYRYQYEVNVFGLINQIQAITPFMRKQRSGRIVVTASVVSDMVMPFVGYYSSTKHAVDGIVSTLRLEMNPFNVKVILIKPGAIKSEFEKNAFDVMDDCTQNSDYEKQANDFKLQTIKMYKDAPDSKYASKYIYKALTSNNPKVVYYIGKDALLSRIAKKILPITIQDKVILNMFKDKSTEINSKSDFTIE